MDTQVEIGHQQASKENNGHVDRSHNNRCPITTHFALHNKSNTNGTSNNQMMITKQNDIMSLIMDSRAQLTDNDVRLAKRRVFGFLSIKLSIGFALCRLASMAVNHHSIGFVIFIVAYSTMTTALLLATWCPWIQARRWATLICLMVTIKSITSIMWAPVMGETSHSIAITVLALSCLTCMAFMLLTFITSLKSCLRNDLIMTCCMNFMILPYVLSCAMSSPHHENKIKFLIFSYSFMVELYLAIMFDHVLNTVNSTVITNFNTLQHVVYMLSPTPLIIGFPIIWHVALTFLKNL